MFQKIRKVYLAFIAFIFRHDSFETYKALELEARAKILDGEYKQFLNFRK